MWQRPWITHEVLLAGASTDAPERATILRLITPMLSGWGVSGICIGLPTEWEPALPKTFDQLDVPIATLRVRLDVGAVSLPGADSTASTGQSVVPITLLKWLANPELLTGIDLFPRPAMPIVELELYSSQQSDRPSAPRADVRAAILIKQILDAASLGGVRMSLLPRAENWLARVEDSVRLGMRINRASLGLSFSVLDWLRSDGRDLNSSLQLALPRMVNLIVTGCRRDQTGAWQPCPIAQSEFDLGHLLRESARLGYTGAITWLPCFGAPDETASMAGEWAAWQDFVRKARAPRR